MRNIGTTLTHCTEYGPFQFECLMGARLTCKANGSLCAQVGRLHRARRNTNKVVAKLATTLDKVVARDDKVVARNIITLNEEKSINHMHRAFISIP